MKNGPRTLAEQMQGLADALKQAEGCSVLDLGCAEGYIGMEFAKAGASAVQGIEFNPDLVEYGRAQMSRHPALPFELVQADLADIIAAPARPQWDVVLALAILHKLKDPATGVRYCCETARELIIIRLPIGSTGLLRCKYAPHAQCDLRDEMPRLGWRRVHKAPGPRGEWVHYYRRTA